MYCAFCGNNFSGNSVCPNCGRNNGGNNKLSIGSIAAYISIFVGAIGLFLPYVNMLNLVHTNLWGDSFDIENITNFQILAIGISIGLLLELAFLLENNRDKKILSIIVGIGIVLGNVIELFVIKKMVSGATDNYWDIDLSHWIAFDTGFYVLIISGVGLFIAGLVMIHENKNCKVDLTYSYKTSFFNITQKNVDENKVQDPMLKRIYMLLEDGEWDKADDLCEQMLNANPENAEVYLAKLMIDYKSNNMEDLSKGDVAFDDNNNFKKILRFGDSNLVKLLKEYNSVIKERVAINNLSTPEEIYDCAYNYMISARNEDEYNKAISLFDKIHELNDSEERIERCKEDIKEKNNKYNKAKYHINKQTVEGYTLALSILKDIDGWKDSSHLITTCQNTISDYNDEKDRVESLLRKKEQQKRTIKLVIVSLAVVIVLIVLICLIKNIISTTIKEKMRTGAISVYQNLEVGDSFNFGTYEQDNNINNGKESIEWIVINKTNDKILVISKYILDYEKFYNATDQDISNNNVRNWLIKFSNEAFSEYEIELILDNGNNDKVFLLNSNDIKMLGENIQCENTEYVRAKRSSVFTFGDWWLEGTEGTLYWVSSNGEIDSYQLIRKKADDYILTQEAFFVKGVRPCMWLSVQ